MAKPDCKCFKDDHGSDVTTAIAWEMSEAFRTMMDACNICQSADEHVMETVIVAILHTVGAAKSGGDRDGENAYVQKTLGELTARLMQRDAEMQGEVRAQRGESLQ